MDNGQVIFPGVSKIRITAKTDIQKMRTKRQSMVGGNVPKQVEPALMLDMDVNDVRATKMEKIVVIIMVTAILGTSMDIITTVDTIMNPHGIVN